MTQKTSWYIEPKDSHTNKVLQSELGGPELVHLKNNLGKTLLVYEVDHVFITKLKKSEDELHLDFKVYKKQGKNSAAREFDFSHLAKKIKKAEKTKN
jgi:hypothetical protein